MREESNQELHDRRLKETHKRKISNALFWNLTLFGLVWLATSLPQGIVQWILYLLLAMYASFILFMYLITSLFSKLQYIINYSGRIFSLYENKYTMHVFHLIAMSASLLPAGMLWYHNETSLAVIFLCNSVFQMYIAISVFFKASEPN